MTDRAERALGELVNTRRLASSSSPEMQDFQ